MKKIKKAKPVKTFVVLKIKPVSKKQLAMFGSALQMEYK
jgi:hypothetical protein